MDGVEPVKVGDTCGGSILFSRLGVCDSLSNPLLPLSSAQGPPGGAAEYIQLSLANP